MRRDLINRMVNNLLHDQKFKNNSLFPKSFYNLTPQEQKEVIKQYKLKQVYRPPQEIEFSNNRPSVWK